MLRTVCFRKGRPGPPIQSTPLQGKPFVMKMVNTLTGVYIVHFVPSPLLAKTMGFLMFVTNNDAIKWLFIPFFIIKFAPFCLPAFKKIICTLILKNFPLQGIKWIETSWTYSTTSPTVNCEGSHILNDLLNGHWHRILYMFFCLRSLLPTKVSANLLRVLLETITGGVCTFFYNRGKQGRSRRKQTSSFKKSLRADGRF